MQASQLTDLVHDAIDDLKGRDVVTLDVTNLTDITDTMVIATGTSNRHVNAMVNEVVTQAKQAGLKPMGVEGADQGDWVLIDLGDVVVHVMREDARSYYELERLWSAPADESVHQDH
ncbi:MAG: ribosome silencing factor [Pseudomonadaceae bacterium]|nr:ribosome silencing factor [Pseudomonadaceae bacterium]